MVNDDCRERRNHWVEQLPLLGGTFDENSNSVITMLREEVAEQGIKALLEHLQICGAVPEHYGRDSSEEKLYSKYTDAVVSEALNAIGLQSIVIRERADSADVQATGDEYSLVADAKAFRLSRTAKNQKDFKIEALSDWRGDSDFALVVCPIYQLPFRTSQIYQQAINRNVCILSYSHLASLVGLVKSQGTTSATRGLSIILNRVSVLQPNKSASAYWIGINEGLIQALGDDRALWTQEKVASQEGLSIAKWESIMYLRRERERLLGLSHIEAINELVRISGIDSRIRKVESVPFGNLMDFSICTA